MPPLSAVLCAMLIVAATSRLTVRPVAFPSAIVCLGTIHKLLLLLTSIPPPEDMNKKKDEW